MPLTDDELSEQKEWADDPVVAPGGDLLARRPGLDLDEMVKDFITGKRIVGNQD